MDDTQRGRPLPANWATLTTPALVADGEQTPQPYLRPGADALAALLPNGRRLTVAGQDHAVAPELIDYFT